MQHNKNLGTYALIALAIQNSTLCLFQYYGRLPDKNGNVFFAPTAVFLTEALKIISSLLAFYLTVKAQKQPKRRKVHQYEDSVLESDSEKLAILTDSYDNIECEEDLLETGERAEYVHTSVIRYMMEEILTKNAFKAVIPAILYVIQNNLQLIGASYLDASQFQIISQLKILSTAAFSVALLRKKINRSQWACLFVLVVGIVVVQRQGADSSTQGVGNKSHLQNYIYGILAMLGATTISGFAGVYTEMILKKSGQMWATNVHLAAFSLVLAATPLIADAIRDGRWNPMRFFGAWAWAIVIFNCIGGMLVAMVITYTDNIQKAFSISASIVMTLAFTVIVGTSSISIMHIVGASLVIGAIYCYNRSAQPAIRSITSSPTPSMEGFKSPVVTSADRSEK